MKIGFVGRVLAMIELNEEFEALVWAMRTGKYPGIDDPRNYGAFLAHCTIKKVRELMSIPRSSSQIYER
jgi:hypothetical protein